MVASRRQRAKQEGTFLESVKILMEEMKLEIKRVGDTVNTLAEISRCSFSAPHDWNDAGLAHGWYDAAVWNALGFVCNGAWEPMLHLGTRCDTETGPLTHYGSHACNEAATTPISIQRDTLLAYRALASRDPSPCTDALTKAVSCKTDDPPTSRCGRCEQTKDECICFALYCRRCAKSAEKCQCACPLTRYRRCASCGTLEVQNSLFDETHLPEVPSSFRCSGCGAEETCQLEDMVLCNLDSASECIVCERVDAQESLVNCNGQGCDALLHKGCALAASPPKGCSHNVSQFYLCPPCTEGDAAVVCGDCLLFPTSANVDKGKGSSEGVPHAKIESSLGVLNERMDYILQLVELVDADKASLPKAARDVAYVAVKICYAWLQAEGEKVEEDVQDHIQHLDRVMSQVMPKLHR